MMHAALSLVLLLAAAETPMRLAPGVKAADFSLPASNGRTVKLADYLGKKTIVLAFYPKAFTGG
jgi:peroxiredoxin Q/BCP